MIESVPQLSRSHDRARSAFSLWVLSLIVGIGARGLPSRADDLETPNFPDILDLDVSSLLATEVNSVSKTKKNISETAAAVYVLPSNSIVRSGARSIPEALRAVPGLHVAQISSNSWAISARGLNGEFSRNLLVMIDGVSVYNPSLGGVDWDMIDVMIEDVDRIEIVRGPGGAVWGANAVNGVINVITKKASDTLGGIVVAGVGKEESKFGTVRQGWRGKSGDYRWYVRNRSVDSQRDKRHQELPGKATTAQTGFRFDSPEGGAVHKTLQGDLLYNETRQDLIAFVPASPFLNEYNHQVSSLFGTLRGEWSRALHSGDQINARSYFTYVDRDFQFHRERRLFWDGEVQHQASLSAHNQMIWGINGRVIADRQYNFTDAFLADPGRRTYGLVGLFAQNEQVFLDGMLRVQVGTKVERNAFTGVEWQPSLRAVVVPGENHRFWSSVGRAVRIPARLEDSSSFYIPTKLPLVPGTLPHLIHRFGDSRVGPEVLVGYEGGYRYQPNVRFYIDLAGYINHYRGILSYGGSTPGQSIDPVTGLTFDTITQRLVNGISGHIVGFEALADWRAHRWLSLQGWFSRCDFTRAQGIERSAELVHGVIPHNQAYLRAFVDLSEQWSITLAGRFVDSMIAYRIPSYTNLDARLSWKAFPNIEYSLSAKDMFATSRVEFPNSGFRKLSTERIERRYLGQVSWKF